MSKLSKFQHAKCLEITEKLINWPICSPFIEMVDPERDGAPDYFEFIKKPMALNEVKRKIIANEYETITEWEDDVNLIWSNAITYNGEDTLFTHMAKEASLWFSNKMKRFPSTQEEDWTGKIQRTTKKLLDVLSHPPTDLDPSGKLSAEGEGRANGKDKE
ncbi:Bromodomain containing protein [Histomonas meleagridis]|uniref:Bromodomain containing protein n=1 Tax=Histomonas meleagridis TaxID=135588 RepID=UPI00355A397A|nr:Bromodomain containing protein [Histomonas meleagridis]KAH0797423.1 Bromodomain containing protein [Histomonas meleagridis]